MKTTPMCFAQCWLIGWTLLSAEVAAMQPNIIPPNTEKTVCNVASLMAVANVYAAQSCIEHDGMTRCWYTYIPESVKEAAGDDESVALVMDLHGYNLCAAESAQYSCWNRTAAEVGFIVVWPQGNANADYSNDPSWDFGPCCASLGESPPVSDDTDTPSLPPPADLDDADFLRQVAANVVASSAMEGVTVDTNRLYVAGHSNGCMMAQAMAALQSDLVAAVCCHASSLLVEPSRHVSSDVCPSRLR